MRIGEAAAQLDVPAHVLRHWEDVGVLVPGRSAAGHRRYDDELVARARLVQVCQRAGLSLAEIRRLGRFDDHGRVAEIERKRTDLAADIEALSRAHRFLGHVLECRHPVVTECPDCAGFAAR